VQKLTWTSPRPPYVIKLGNYPNSFQEDVARFQAHVGPGNPAKLFEDLIEPDPDAPVRPDRPLRASSVELRVQQILLAAAALVHSGRPIDSIRTLRDLVEPHETARTIAVFYWKRGGGKRGSFIGGIMEALRQLAKYHCRLPEPEVAAIARLRERTMPATARGMCPRNRERLRAIIERPVRAMLLHLPEELMRRAAATDTSTALRLAQTAVALEILFVCPLRISNLTNLQIDRNLRRSMVGDRRITHIVLAPHEVKNETAIEWPVPEASARGCSCSIIPAPMSGSAGFSGIAALPSRSRPTPAWRRTRPRSSSTVSCCAKEQRRACWPSKPSVPDDSPSVL
jgi:hypothetical protein